MRPVYFLYLLVYIVTGSTFSLLVKKSSQDNGGKQPYEPIAVTLAVEAFKFAVAFTIVFFVNNREQSGSSKLRYLLTKWDTAKQFAVPAFLYCLFNGLAFYNLRLVTPPTYRLLINLKVVFSGVLLQVLIGTKLTQRKWIGIVLLLVACGVEQIDSFDFNTGLLPILLISFQAFCSSFAGVYFQLLLQFGGGNRDSSSPPAPAAVSVPGSELGLWEKNLFMYCWTLFFNLLYLALFNPAAIFDPMSVISSFDAMVVPIVVMSGVGGVSTSLILRDMDVIVKEYANFVEMCVVVVGSCLLLGTALHLSLFAAIALVTVSLYLYNVPGAHEQKEKPPSEIAMKQFERSPDGSLEGEGDGDGDRDVDGVSVAVSPASMEGDDELDDEPRPLLQHQHSSTQA